MFGRKTVTKPVAVEPEQRGGTVGFAELDSELALKASAKLGYDGMRHALSRSETEKALTEILRAASVKPYNTEAVNAYMRDMRMKMSSGSVDFRWNETALPQYRNPIPSHILAKALAVHEAAGTLGRAVSFSVYDLRAFDRTRDPILEVHHGNASAYIGIWDEPSFKP